MTDTNPPAEKKPETTLVALTPGTRRRLKAVAQAEDRTMAYVIRRAIDAELARLENVPTDTDAAAAWHLRQAAARLDGGESK